jgi:hypothetical protein
MKKIKRLADISWIDFHLPSAVFGSNFDGPRKRCFDTLKSKIKICLVTNCESTNVLAVLDEIEVCKKIGSAKTIQVICEIVQYLRVKLLSDDGRGVHNVLILLDAMIKNSGFPCHVAIGKKEVMKTISKVIRRNWVGSCKTSPSYIAADFGVDCIQAWGEAFTRRQSLFPGEIYPHFIG